jgi:Ca-activated chloride channel homolog
MKTGIAQHITAMLTAGLFLGDLAAAGQVKLEVSLANPVLPADKRQTTFLKVGLTGFRMQATRRTPVNIALVIDKSGSMAGQKIEYARDAALSAVERLNRDDIVSVVAYDDSVTILVPATKASDKQAIRAGIRRLTSGGSTALYAGACKGAQEVRKFLDRNCVNRVILLSDGLANVGPDSPAALGALGASLAKEGIAVTTLGLGHGYNEDLMTQLAQRSDGNHAFVEHPNDLARIFNCEFGDALSVVAQEVLVKINCSQGVRPVRALGRDAEISGCSVITSLSQILSNQEKYFVLEVEVDGGQHGSSRPIATVEVSYANLETETTDRLTSAVAVRFSNSSEDVEVAIRKPVMADAIMQVATADNELAMRMRDSGRVEEARGKLESNVRLLTEQAGKLGSEALEAYSRANYEDARNLDDASWSQHRKTMRELQLKNTHQRSY